MYFVSFPFMIHLRYSTKVNWGTSTKPLFHGAWDDRGLCLMFYRWHNVMIPLFMDSVPLTVTKISGNPNFAIQCSQGVCCICIMRYWVECYIVSKCINYNHYIWVSFWRRGYWFFCIKWDSVVKRKALSFKILFFCYLFLMWVWFI